MTQDAVAELLKNVQADVKAAREGAEKTNAARLEEFEVLKVDVAKGSKTTTENEAKIARIAEDQAKNVTRLQGLEEAINALMKHQQRPGGQPEDKNKVARREQAIGLLEQKHENVYVKQADLRDHPFAYTEDQIAEAEVYIKALRALMHAPNRNLLSEEYNKALSAFTFGTQGFIMAPEQSNEILSCLVDVTDITGLMRNMTISGPSIRFPVDNELWDIAAWACESSCFANNPTQQIGSGLGELEIKPESLRYIVCATRELLDDASANIEGWMIAKVNTAFRHQINAAVLIGDGFGKPMGILNPAAGIPIMDTSLATPVGFFSWQDLVQLKWSVPMSLDANAGAYLMNQHTFGMILSMSDANGRPIILNNPTEAGQMVINGSRVVIVQQMPTVETGHTPIAYGNWNRVYMVVNRKNVTMQQDPYSAGFCILYKFEARIGGGVICPNAARLLRIR